MMFRGFALLLVLATPLHAERLVVQAFKTLPSGIAQSDLFIYDDTTGTFDGPIVTGDRIFDSLVDVVVAGDTCSAFVGGFGSGTARHQLTTGFADPVPFFSGGRRHVAGPRWLATANDVVYVVGGFFGGVQVEARDANTGSAGIGTTLLAGPERQGLFWTLLASVVMNGQLHAAVLAVTAEGVTNLLWSWDLETSTLAQEIVLPGIPPRGLSVTAAGELLVTRPAAANGECCEVQRYGADGNALGAAVPSGVFTTDSFFLRTWVDDRDRFWVINDEGAELIAIDLATATITTVVTPPEGYQSFLSQVLSPIDCTPTDTVGYAHDGRFTIELEWQSQDDSGAGHVIPGQSTASSDFWFFTPDNTEFIVKVLNACTLNNHYWVFAAGLTNVAYTLRVTDTHTGALREYTNPLGTTAPAITDTGAFMSCP